MMIEVSRNLRGILYVLDKECQATVGRLVRPLPGMDVCQKRKRDGEGEERGSSPHALQLPRAFLSDFGRPAAAPVVVLGAPTEKDGWAHIRSIRAVVSVLFTKFR